MGLLEPRNDQRTVGFPVILDEILCSRDCVVTERGDPLGAIVAAQSEPAAESDGSTPFSEI